MINRLGSSLFEMILYCALSGSLFLNMLSLSSFMYSSSILRRRHEGVLQLTVGLTLWAQDIKSPSRSIIRAEGCTHDRCMIAIDGKDICWLVNKGKLMRFAGRYSTTTKRWTHLSTSTIATQIAHVGFTYSYQGERISGITCCLTRSMKEEVTVLSLRCAV